MPTLPSHAHDWETCLSEDVILAFHNGEASEVEREHIHEHVDGCEHCRSLVMLAAGLDEGSGSPAEVDNSSERLSSFLASQFPWRTFGDGKRLANRFEISRFVERGGMGEVYEAFDSVLGCRVALKTLLVNTGDNARALDRLGQEVSLARRVAHPHVCRIYDLHEHYDGEQRPLRFLAMEFITGETLKDRLQASPLSLDEVGIIARQLLQGLGAIHAAGVLHLDFKSQNVMLRSGEATLRSVVMDFSLSRAFEKELHLRTSERQLAGSIGYMSPEQLECQATLGPAADVYSFGVVLFEMLTGHMPFEGDSPASIIFKQLKKTPPPPSSFRPEIGAALDELVLTCLSRARRARFQTVEAVQLELEHCLGQRSARTTTRNRRKRAIIGVLALSVLTAVIIIGNSLKWAAPPLHVEAALKVAQARSAEIVAAPPVVPATAPPAEPSPAKPPAAEPSAAKPSAAKPSAAKPSAAKPSAAKPSPAKSSPAKPPPTRPLPQPAPEWVPERAPDFLL